MPHLFNQSASAYRSCVNVGNERTFSASRSAGTATQISVEPMSMPAALGRITGRTAPSVFLSFPFLAIAFSPLPETTAQDAKTGTLLNGIAADQHNRSPHVTT